MIGLAHFGWKALKRLGSLIRDALAPSPPPPVTVSVPEEPGPEDPRELATLHVVYAGRLWNVSVYKPDEGGDDQTAIAVAIMDAQELINEHIRSYPAAN